MIAELALDAGGKFWLRASRATAISVYSSANSTDPAVMNTVKNIIGVYATPLIEVATKCMFRQHHAGRRLS